MKEEEKKEDYKRTIKIHMPKDLKLEDMKAYCDQKVKEFAEKYRK